MDPSDPGTELDLSIRNLTTGQPVVFSFIFRDCRGKGKKLLLPAVHTDGTILQMPSNYALFSVDNLMGCCII